MKQHQLFDDAAGTPLFSVPAEAAPPQPWQTWHQRAHQEAQKILDRVCARYQAFVDGGKQGQPPYITEVEMHLLEIGGHTVHVYPRKKVAKVNGWMSFTLRSKPKQR